MRKLVITNGRMDKIMKVFKTQDAPYLINCDECKSIETHWIVLYVTADNVTYFDFFGVQCILKEIKKFIGTKNITARFIEYQNTKQCCEDT